MSISASDSYSPRFYRYVRLTLLVLVLLGLRFAAVQDMAGKCVTENQCLADRAGCLGDASGILLNQKTTHCELTAGGWLRVALSEYPAPVRNPAFLHLVAHAPVSAVTL